MILWSDMTYDDLRPGASHQPVQNVTIIDVSSAVQFVQEHADQPVEVEKTIGETFAQVLIESFKTHLRAYFSKQYGDLNQSIAAQAAVDLAQSFHRSMRQNGLLPAGDFSTVDAIQFLATLDLKYNDGEVLFSDAQEVATEIDLDEAVGAVNALLNSSSAREIHKAEIKEAIQTVAQSVKDGQNNATWKISLSFATRTDAADQNSSTVSAREYFTGGTLEPLYGQVAETSAGWIRITRESTETAAIDDAHKIVVHCKNPKVRTEAKMNSRIPADLHMQNVVVQRNRCRAEMEGKLRQPMIQLVLQFLKDYTGEHTAGAPTYIQL